MTGNEVIRYGVDLVYRWLA